jgi:hypothetical protein
MWVVSSTRSGEKATGRAGNWVEPWTQKKYRSSNSGTPVILVTIPIYPSKGKLRNEGRSWQLLWLKCERTELSDICCLRSHNCELCATVRDGREVWCSHGIWYHIDWDMFVPNVGICLPNDTTDARPSVSIYCKAVPVRTVQSLRAPRWWGSQNI